MENAGVIITICGIFLGFYFILKATAQILATRRTQQAQETERLKHDVSAEPADEESSIIEDNHQS